MHAAKNSFVVGAQVRSASRGAMASGHIRRCGRAGRDEFSPRMVCGRWPRERTTCHPVARPARQPHWSAVRAFRPCGFPWGGAPGFGAGRHASGVHPNTQLVLAVAVVLRNFVFVRWEGTMNGLVDHSPGSGSPAAQLQSR